MKAKTIGIINYKGGCTKTSSTVGLGSALARSGYQVLLVDCDPQGHLARHLGISHDDIQISLGDVLGSRNNDVADIILETSEKNLWLVPSHRGLLHSRERLVNRPRRDAILSRALKSVRNQVDFILIDTPPDEGILTVNVMYASNYLIIPTPLDSFSLRGMEPLADSIHTMKDAYEGRSLDILGVLINCYDKRMKCMNETQYQELKEAFGDLIFDTRIRTDAQIQQAQSEGKTIFQTRKHSKGAADYMSLANEVIHRVAM